MKQFFTFISLYCIFTTSFGQTCPNSTRNINTTKHSCNGLGSLSFEFDNYEILDIEINFDRNSNYYWDFNFSSQESGILEHYTEGSNYYINNLIAGDYNIIIRFPNNSECNEINFQVNIPYYVEGIYQPVFNQSINGNVRYYSKSDNNFMTGFPSIFNTIYAESAFVANPANYQNLIWHKGNSYTGEFAPFDFLSELPEYGYYYCEVYDNTTNCLLETSPIYLAYNVPVNSTTAESKQFFCKLDAPKISDIKYSVQSNNGALYKYYADFYDAPSISANKYYDKNTNLIHGKTYYLLTKVDVSDFYIYKTFNAIDFTPVTVEFIDENTPTINNISYNYNENQKVLNISDPYQISESIETNEYPYYKTIYKYEYSLNDGSYQTSMYFENLNIGIHKLKIREDGSNCKITESTIDLNTLSVYSISKKTILVSPNPAQNEITILGIEPNNTIILLDVSGRKIIQHTAQSNTEKLNLSNLQSGTYFLKTSGLSGENTFKIIKN